MRLYAPGATVRLRSMPGGMHLDLPLTYDQEVLADSPLGYWKCDEASGLTAFDSSGNGRNLASAGDDHHGAPAVMPSATRSIDFQGHTVDFYSRSDDTWMSPHAGASGKMTLECWVNFSSLAAPCTMWWKGVTSNFEFSLVALTDGSVQFGVFTAAGGAAGTATSAASVVVTSSVYHIVGTWDRAGNAIKVYVNGSEVATATTSADSSDTTSFLYFGERDSGNDRRMRGTSSHWAMYGTALSASRIAAHYAAA